LSCQKAQEMQGSKIERERFELDGDGRKNEMESVV
jgi:hypothetical protein